MADLRKKPFLLFLCGFGIAILMNRWISVVIGFLTFSVGVLVGLWW